VQEEKTTWKRAQMGGRENANNKCRIVTMGGREDKGCERERIIGL